MPDFATPPPAAPWTYIDYPKRDSYTMIRCLEAYGWCGPVADFEAGEDVLTIHGYTNPDSGMDFLFETWVQVV